MKTNFKDNRLFNVYFNAVINAYINKLITIFHKKALMNVSLGNDIMDNKEVFYEDVYSNDLMSNSNIDCRYVINNIEICGNIASATIFVDNFFFIATVINKFHLIKDFDKWQIICKTFTTV